MQPVEMKRGKEQHVYAASGGKERQRAVCICSQWRQREAKRGKEQRVYAANGGKEQRVYAANGGKEQHVCIEQVWGANLQRIVPLYNEQG